MLPFKRFIKSAIEHPIILMKCHKNLWFVIATFLLLCLSLPCLQNYLSSHTINNKGGIGTIGISPKPADGSSAPKIRQPVIEPDQCSGRYIYIHDLPPRFNQELVKNCRTLSKWFDFCPYLINHGFGSQLDRKRNSGHLESIMSGKSWYATNQFMSSVIFHYRMKQYECLTRNSSLASAIYAPFYAGLEVGQHLWDGFNSSIKDAAALNFVTWLRGKPEWSHLYGWDHFFVAGRITWDFRRLSNRYSDWGSSLLNLPESKNMTMLTIESSPYGKNDFAIPYPTYFHPSNISKVFEWQDRVRRKERPYLFSFGGAPRPNARSSIRGELINQCRNASSSRCNLVNCEANNMCNKPAHIIKMFMQSDFCLQPPGDSYTRRSTFDSILAGCIPVFFHPGSAYIQYSWHFPKNYTKYSVFIPMDGIKNGSVNVQDVLSRISDEDVLAMREEVIGMIPRIIYARKKLKGTEDAFDLAVKRVLERIEGARREIRQGKDPDRDFPEESSWKYYLTGKVEKHEWDSFF